MMEGRDIYEEVLDEVLPTVFAIVKDTARRFTENEVVEVTACLQLRVDERQAAVDEPSAVSQLCC